MSQSASVTSVTELQARRAVREMQARRSARGFLWQVPNLGMAVIVGFRPAASAASHGFNLAQTAR